MTNLIGALEFAGDPELQRLVWVEKVPGLTSIVSIGEFYCQFFDDNDMDGFITEEIAVSPLNDDERNAVVRFRDALTVIEKLPSYHSNDDVATIRTPEWLLVVKCAQLTRLVLSSRQRLPASTVELIAEPIVPADRLQRPLN